jgi:hypothetical protein
VPIIPFGTGTALERYVAKFHGCISLQIGGEAGLRQAPFGRRDDQMNYPVSRAVSQSIE